MRKQIALLLIAASVAVGLMSASSASAASSYIKVTTTLTARVDACRAAVDQVSYGLEFKAKIKRRNASKPKSVRVTFKVIDAATGTNYGTRVVTLTPKNKYRNASKSFTVPAGTSVIYDTKSVYRAPNTGRKITATGQFSDATPTVADMDAGNPALPPCAVG